MESFRKYCEEEMLSGDDKYDAGDLGKQDAKKFVKFTSFPPVLQLHLKRFQLTQTSWGYGYEKVNDHYSFPSVLHLDEFLYEPSEVPQTYALHGVLVHSGSLNSGHYYAYVRPGLSPKWFKFNDDIVTAV